MNVQKALTFDPTSPDVYGQLGIIYFKGKNYEGAIPALKCAIYGCDAVESCAARQCDPIPLIRRSLSPGCQYPIQPWCITTPMDQFWPGLARPPMIIAPMQSKSFLRSERNITGIKIS